MKVRASVKPICEKCKVIKRNGKVMGCGGAVRGLPAWDRDGWSRAFLRLRVQSSSSLGSFTPNLPHRRQVPALRAPNSR